MSGIELANGRCLDWLEGTIPVKGCKPSERAAELAQQFGGMTPLDNGRFGYSAGASVYSSGRIFWADDRPEMGVHFSLPSSALERSNGDWQAWCAVVWWDRGEFTRCDLALDQCETPIAVVAEAVRSRQVVSHFQQANRLDNLWGDGSTIYLGSPASDTRVRIYDKRAEMIARGEECPHETLVRCEVQWRRKRANQVMRELVAGADVAGLVRGVVDFRDLAAAKQSNRAEITDWWERWMSGAAAVKLAIQKRKSDLDAMRAWVKRQVAATLGVLLQADKGNPYWLLDEAQRGWERAPGWKRQLVSAPV